MNIHDVRSVGGFGRDAPRRRWLVAAAALVGIGLAGCQSFSPCGLGDPCRGPGPIKKLGQRMFNRHGSGAVVVDGCEPGLIGAGAATIDGCPPVVSSPAGISPGPMGVEESPPLLDLSPANPPAGGTSNGGTSTTPGSGPTGSTRGRGEAGRAVYETMRPGTRRDGLASNAASDPLANLPRLAPPSELVGVPAVAPEAEKVAVPTAGSTDPAAAAAGVKEVNTDASDEFPVPAAETTSLAPGIASFKVVEPRLAGGSLPRDSGWSWLAEQGYKTVIDLRPSNELRSADLAAVNASGLRYVALPTSDAVVDSPSHLARFAAEIAQEQARPIYFFDTTGARAAVLWYLHEVVNLKAIASEAERGARELGPIDASLWARARVVVDRLKPNPANSNAALPGTPEPPSSPVPDRESTGAVGGAAAPAQSPPGSPPPSGFVPPAARTSDLNAPAGTEAGEVITPSFTPSSSGRDTANWKPYAALAAAGMSVPIAFVGRTALSRAGLVARASLMGPRLSPRAIRDESGE
jgi:protein tyrosine phosphatase (PTP) superfamily phosphohydrolase (DUF442 family)